jgi:hypothetical protein
LNECSSVEFNVGFSNRAQLSVGRTKTGGKIMPEDRKKNQGGQQGAQKAPARQGNQGGQHTGGRQGQQQGGQQGGRTGQRSGQNR